MLSSVFRSVPDYDDPMAERVVSQYAKATRALRRRRDTTHLPSAMLELGDFYQWWGREEEAKTAWTGAFDACFGKQHCLDTFDQEIASQNDM